MFKKICLKLKNLYTVKNYLNLVPYVKPYKLRAFLAILVTLPIGAMDAVIPWALKQYMDSLSTTTKNIKFIALVPFLIILFSVFQSVLTYLATYLNTWVGAQISNGLKRDLFKKLMRFDASFFDNTTSGVIQARFNSDVDLACSGFLNHLKMFATRIFNSCSLIITLLVISWRLAIVAILVLAIALYPLTIIRKRIKDVAHDSVYSGAAVSNHYLEAFNGNRIISSYNLYSHQLKKFSEALLGSFKLRIKMAQRSGMLSPIMHLVVGIGIAIIIWFGSYLIMHGYLTVGGFTGFVVSVIMLYQPIKSIGNDFNSVQLSIMAIERVFAMLQKTPKIVDNPNAISIDSVNEDIEYRDVCFAYEPDRPVLKNISFRVNVGESVALVGNSGGGKTTIASLLSRFHDVTSGKILIDGTDIRDIQLDSLRSKISVVFQDNFLFQGTIRDNILLGNEKASQTDVEKAVKASCLEEFIASLKHGLDTQIGERGVLLSGGQKQRIAIARAFLKNAPIVILDEATSALDNKSERIVQQAINNLMKDRTVFIIAHRLSTIKNAHKIIVINHGQIAEIGNHNELMQHNGAYSSLYNSTNFVCD